MKKRASLLLLFLVGIGCHKESAPPPPPPATTLAPTPTTVPPLSVAGVTLGSAVDADKKVSAAKDTFGAKDTIYASVAMAGAGHAKLRALWSFVKGGKSVKVDETTIELDASAPTVNEFHIAKPSGWPKGDYKIDLFLGDGAEPAVTKTFKVA